MVKLVVEKVKLKYEPTVPLASKVRQAEDPLRVPMPGFQSTRGFSSLGFYSLELANQVCQLLYTVLCLVQSIARQFAYTPYTLVT